MENGNNIKEVLEDEISKAIEDVSYTKEVANIKSLSRYKPEKVAQILYLFSTGVSQTTMVKKYGLDRRTIINTLVDYSDYKNRFRELGGKLSARNYVDLSSLTEDLTQALRDRVDSGDLEVTFRDLKDLSIAIANASREALTARGEASQITEERKVYTQEDYEQTKEAALKRIKDIRGEILDGD